MRPIDMSEIIEETKQLLQRVAAELPVRRPELFQPIRLFRELDGEVWLSKKSYAVLFSQTEELGRCREEQKPDAGWVGGHLLLLDQKGQVFLATVRGVWSLWPGDPSWRAVSTIRRLNPENPQLPEEVAFLVKDALLNLLRD